MGAPVFLCGMMGSGKSSVGRWLASGLSAPFIDLDVRIERMFGETISEAFARGESYFRRMERAALTSLVREPGFEGRTVIVATGGGTVVDPLNRVCMDAAGVRVLLRVPPPELAARVATGEAGRPLVAEIDDPLPRLTALWAQRRAAYEDVSYQIDGVGSVEMVALRIAAALDLTLQTGETL